MNDDYDGDGNNGGRSHSDSRQFKYVISLNKAENANLIRAVQIVTM
jgi:hypothetical protein